MIWLIATYLAGFATPIAILMWAASAPSEINYP